MSDGQILCTIFLVALLAVALIGNHVGWVRDQRKAKEREERRQAMLKHPSSGLFLARDES